MSDDKSDIVSILQQGGTEPKDTSPDAGFVGITADGESVKLGEKPDYTRNLGAEDIHKQ